MARYHWLVSCATWISCAAVGAVGSYPEAVMACEQIPGSSLQCLSEVGKLFEKILISRVLPMRSSIKLSFGQMNQQRNVFLLHIVFKVLNGFQQSQSLALFTHGLIVGQCLGSCMDCIRALSPRQCL